MRITAISTSSFHAWRCRSSGRRWSTPPNRPDWPKPGACGSPEKRTVCAPTHSRCSSTARRRRRHRRQCKKSSSRANAPPPRKSQPQIVTASRRAMRRHHELPFGAEPVPGGVRFRLWAPGAQSVSLMLTESYLMQPEPGGWWLLVTDRAAPGARYRYRVDGIEVPDPASRYQPDGVHEASEVVDPSSYQWSDSGWGGRALQELVIYELHVGTFSAGGTFAGDITS